MKWIINPQQSLLFDPFDPVLTEKTRARLLDDWPGVFRHVILELLQPMCWVLTTVQIWGERRKSFTPWQA